ncbi:ATP-binding protein [Sulfurimonas sp.]|uniref:ATP-binding protein n=1 Tax=Sulfurimonas sp. TaxID=2022749 RepID=UPI0025E7C3AF|nr:ATP-binding protein [Sulfurimonas sp.]
MQFRTKARAVDLLGKGQIADLPTAITELWKNGYDAYADNLTAEIYLEGYKDIEKNLFVMTDDGKGMSRRDILEKWLVLGTDSKSRTKLKDLESEDTLWKKPRIKSGEKGIGRLSVAFLGSPMLMLTKKMGHPLQALFFDWRLLENYNLFLDDVNIPVRDVESLNDFYPTLELLKKEFLGNFDKVSDSDGSEIWEDSQSKLRNDIEKSINEMITPNSVINPLISEFTDIENSHGTKFIIFEPIDQIIKLTNKDEDEIEDKKFVISSLSGFTNEFKKNNKSINTNIPVFKKGNIEYDFLNTDGNFWSYNDYELADVIIEGEFDGRGSFEGFIMLYDKKINYTYTNPRRKDARTDYGSFPIKLGYSQGLESESKLEGTVFYKMRERVGEYGGLYVYRDNFRVLPYGRTDFDFLGFEKRRAKSAGEYYFSHRRMFGYIELTRNENSTLRDKSSREGMMNNAAYRALKNDLEAFFIDLAKEYFRTEPKQSIFKDKQKQLIEQHNAIKADSARETEAKKAFTRSLKDYPLRLEKYQEEYKSLINQLEEKTNQSDIIYSDIESLLDRIQTLDIDYKRLLPKIPKRYKPTDTQLDRLSKYESLLINFNETIKKDSADLMVKVQEKLEIQALKKEFLKSCHKYNANLEKQIFHYRQELHERFEYLKKEYSQRSNRILKDLTFEKDQLTHTIDTREKAIAATQKIALKFEFLQDQLDTKLFPLTDHIKRLSFEIDEELLQGAYKTEYDNIKRQWEQTKETAQLGIAVEIIDHEFNHLYATINTTFDKLTRVDTYENDVQLKYLKTYFKQLEDKYALLSPLYRISGVIPRNIQCKTIYEYLNNFFANKLENQEIEFTASEAFLNHYIEIKEPVIHTVFINVINNALYWLRNAKIKKLHLDYWSDTNEILIVNSGLKIEDHRLERIFELFYSNRPNGRGIGLFLAKESLNENYFDMYATNDKTYNHLKGACFVIKSLS